MTQTLEAVFDGETLRPEKPLDLQRNMRVRITIEYVPTRQGAAFDRLEVL